MGFEEKMRHKGKNLLIKSCFTQRMKQVKKQNTLFSECAPTANLTAIAQESRVLILLITSLAADVPWELW